MNNRGLIAVEIVLLTVVAGLTTYTFIPSTLRDFREKKYVGQCMSDGSTIESCNKNARELSGKDLLEAIRDK